MAISSRLRSTVLATLLLITICVVVMVISPGLAERLLFFPTRGYPGPPPVLAGFPGEDVSLTASDGVGIHGWYYEAGDQAPLVLFFHGNAGDISGRTPIALGLLGQGLSVFLLEYRGYGSSEGSPTEEGLYRDGRAGYEFAVEKTGSPRRVVIFGRSMGGAVAARIAAEEEAAALILEAAFTSLYEIGQAVYPWLPSFLFSRVKGRFSTLDAVRQVKMPVLVVHGTRDEIVPIQMGLQLFEAAGEPKDWLGLPSAGHNDTYLVGGEEYFRRLARFARGAIEEDAAEGRH